jgi:hypothetical protein
MATAFDDLTNDNSNDAANFIRLALQDYVNSGESDGPNTSQVFVKEFKKEKVQNLAPDVDTDLKVDVEAGDLRFRADFLTELDGRGAKGQNLDELMVNIARSYFDAGDLIGTDKESSVNNGSEEGSGQETDDAPNRFQLDDKAIVDGGGKVALNDLGGGTFEVRLGHDIASKTGQDPDEIKLRFDNADKAAEFAAFAQLTFDMLSGEIDLGGSGDIGEAEVTRIAGNADYLAEAKMQHVIDTDRFDFTDWAFDDAGENTRIDVAQFIQGAIEADGTSLGQVFVKVEEAVTTEDLEKGPSAKADIESGDLSFTSSGMTTLTGDKHASLDEVLIDAARGVFDAKNFFDDNPEAGDAEDLFQLDDSAVVDGEGTVTLSESKNPNNDYRVDLGQTGDSNEIRLVFGDGSDQSDDTASLDDAEQFAAFAEITMAILSGDIKKSGSDFKAVGGYNPDIGGDAAEDANELVTDFLETDNFDLFM